MGGETWFMTPKRFSSREINVFFITSLKYKLNDVIQHTNQIKMR